MPLEPPCLPEILTGFDTISLEEMDKVKLMDRKDTKFIFREERLADILHGLTEIYRILKVEGRVCSTYESVYYDTPGHLFFHQHHKGKLNRFKVRFRRYIDTGQLYLEIKFKSNKKRTVKSRMKVKSKLEILDETALQFLQDNAGLGDLHLEPTLWISFQRITLVSLASPERVTLDTRIVFRQQGLEIPVPGIIICESKQERAKSSPFVTQLKDQGIRRGSLSKYCLGMSLMQPCLKMNLFKPKIKHIKHLSYVPAASAE